VVIPKVQFLIPWVFANKYDIDEHGNHLRRDIEVLRMEVKRDLAETRAELIRWVIGAGFLQTTLMVGVLV